MKKEWWVKDMRRKEEKNVYTPFSVVFSALKCKWDKELGFLWLSIQLKGLDTDNSSFISGEYLGKKVLFFFSFNFLLS